jgi:hypothetical protein
MSEFEENNPLLPKSDNTEENEPVATLGSEVVGYETLPDEEKTEIQQELAKEGIENFLIFFNKKTNNRITYSVLQRVDDPDPDPLEPIINEFTWANKFPTGKVGLFREKMKFFMGNKKDVVELHDIMDLTKSFNLNSDEGSNICAAQKFILSLLAVIKKYLDNTTGKTPIEITTSGSILGSGFERTLRKCTPGYSSVKQYFELKKGGSRSRRRHRRKPSRKTRRGRTRKSKAKAKSKTHRRRHHSHVRKHKKNTYTRRR